MKNSNLTVTETGQSSVPQWVAEPFLVLGVALFWAITLAIVGIVFAGVAAVEEAFRLSPSSAQRLQGQSTDGPAGCF